MREVPGTITPEFALSFHEYVKNLKKYARTHTRNKISSSEEWRGFIEFETVLVTRHDTEKCFYVLDIIDLMISRGNGILHRERLDP